MSYIIWSVHDMSHTEWHETYIVTWVIQHDMRHILWHESYRVTWVTFSQASRSAQCECIWYAFMSLYVVYESCLYMLCMSHVSLWSAQCECIWYAFTWKCISNMWHERVFEITVTLNWFTRVYIACTFMLHIAYERVWITLDRSTHVSVYYMHIHVTYCVYINTVTYCVYVIHVFMLHIGYTFSCKLISNTRSCYILDLHFHVNAYQIHVDVTHWIYIALCNYINVYAICIYIHVTYWICIFVWNDYIVFIWNDYIEVSCISVIELRDISIIDIHDTSMTEIHDTSI